MIAQPVRPSHGDAPMDGVGVSRPVPSDGFETDADRAATLAGLDDDAAPARVIAALPSRPRLAPHTALWQALVCSTSGHAAPRQGG